MAHVKSRASTTGARVIAGYGVGGSFDVLHPGLLVSLLLLSSPLSNGNALLFQVPGSPKSHCQSTNFSELLNPSLPEAIESVLARIIPSAAGEIDDAK